MTDRIAVAVIHGIGSQMLRRDRRHRPLSFSKALHRRLRRDIGRRAFDKRIVWREIFWADILEARQEAYMAAIAGQVSTGTARRLLVRNFSDALAFSRRGTAYNALNERIGTDMAALEAEAGGDAPLVVLAHSFGGRIMSNYIWDLQQGILQREGAFQSFRTMARFVTFGCNLPLFSFAYDPEEIEPIAFPGTALPRELMFEPWWANYFDRHDLLAFPIAPVGPGYQAMADRGDLHDIPINVGGLLTSWNTLSHEKYWSSADFTRPVASMLRRLMARLQGPDL